VHVAFVVRGREQVVTVDAAGLGRRWLIRPGQLPDDRLTACVLEFDSGLSMTLETGPAELAWVQPLSGFLTVDGSGTGTEWTCMVSGGESLALASGAPATVLVVTVPHAADYDANVRTGLRARNDWSTEPVLDSEHDARRRIYLASTGLWSTEAVKGEMIFYPPGSSGAAHHHEGAEHFQYVLKGTGVAHLEAGPESLSAGDLLYNLEHEVHAFENPGDEDFVFVEFFVPGQNRTVWVPGADACGWQPRDTDIRGRPAGRLLEYHVHGQGDV
jgi:quercetin dioxygenase-like cupin family protein